MNKVFGADLMDIALLLFIFIVGLFVTGMFGMLMRQIEKIEEARERRRMVDD
jgi:hypothetical protein